MLENLLPEAILRKTGRVMGKSFMSVAVLFICFIALTVSVYSAPKLDSDVDRTKIGKGEPLVLTVTVDEADAEPDLVEDGDFSLAGQSVFTSTEIINFNMKVKKTFKFTLLPKREGRLMTPEVTISAGGDLIKAPRHSVEVSEKFASKSPISRHGRSGAFEDDEDDEDGVGSLFGQMRKMREAVSRAEKQGLYPFSSRPRDPEIFMRASLGAEKAYVNQQILLNMDVYIPEGYNTDIRFLPSVNEGIMIQQIEPDKEIPHEENGTYYTIRRISVAIYPMKSGDYRLKPFKANWFSSFSGTHTLETDEFDLHVDDLPQPAPADFCGGVGNFELKAECPTASAMVSKPFSVVFSATGKGNASSVTIDVPEADGADRFDSSESIERVIDGDTLKETKKVAVNYVPHSKGRVTVHSVTASFFNPETGKYYSKTSPEISVNAVGEGIKASSAGPAEKQEPSIGIPSFSIKSDMTEGTGKGLAGNPFAISAALLPLLILLSMTVFSRTSLKIRTKESSGRFLTELKKSLKKAEADDDISVLNDAFFSYISSKLSLDKGISVRKMLTELKEKSGDEIAEKAGSIFKLCDHARFAAGSADIAKISGECLETASEIEKILKKEK